MIILEIIGSIIAGIFLIFVVTTVIIPLIWRLILGLFDVFSIFLGTILGFISFLFEAGIFIGLLWLAVQFIGE